MAEIDRVRFGYVLKYRLDELDLSYRQIRSLLGISLRQTSHAVNGRAVDAGATHLLARLCDIELDEMFPVEMQEKLKCIKKLQEKQAVTPVVSHETMAGRDFA
ncbi:MAG: hypothetical protein JKY94_08005 [Rhodobacteraceae bacterium]|nr:hypothetical protein [Paracoccaceae bacterium]